jgi:hypothetical protein
MTQEVGEVAPQLEWCWPRSCISFLECSPRWRSVCCGWFFGQDSGLFDVALRASQPLHNSIRSVHILHLGGLQADDGQCFEFLRDGR